MFESTAAIPLGEWKVEVPVGVQPLKGPAQTPAPTQAAPSTEGKGASPVVVEPNVFGALGGRYLINEFNGFVS